MAQTFMNDADSKTWLIEGHLSAKYAPQPVPEFGSAIIDGNEDCPGQIELFAAVDPDYTDQPVAVYVYNADTGRYDRA